MSAGDSPGIPPASWFAGGEIEQRKFHAYLLNPQHPDGKHKLRLWSAVFGIGEGDGRLLERLIREQVGRGVVSERPSRSKHRSFGVVIPDFRSPDGRTGPVITAWVSDPGPLDTVVPRLVTAFPDVP